MYLEEERVRSLLRTMAGEPPAWKLPASEWQGPAVRSAQHACLCSQTDHAQEGGLLARNQTAAACLPCPAGLSAEGSVFIGSCMSPSLRLDRKPLYLLPLLPLMPCRPVRRGQCVHWPVGHIFHPSFNALQACLPRAVCSSACRSHLPPFF